MEATAQSVEKLSKEQKSLSMEEKIDMILEKMSKIDSIENHFTLLQQDIGKMRSEVKEMDTRLTNIENAVSFMETTYTEVSQTVGRDNRKIKDIEAELKQLKSSQVNKNSIEQQAIQVEHLRTQNEVLTRQVNDLDAYSRRSKLIFEGILQRKEEKIHGKR